MHSDRQSLFFQYAMFIWLAVIWTLSSLPADSIPKLDTFNLDKMAHVIVYFVFSMLIFRNYKMGFFGKLTRQQVMFIAFFLAALDEAHQVLCINRFVSLYDLAANLAGLTLGYFVTGERQEKQ
jgi:VanZ family protein